MVSRIDPRVLAEAEALRDASVRELDAQSLLDRVVDALHRVGDADHVLFYRVGESASGRRVVASAFRGGERFGGMVRSAFGALDRIQRNDAALSSWVPRNLRPIDTRAFVEAAHGLPRPALEACDMFRSVWYPAGIDDQQRLMVRDGSELVGWVGVFRDRKTPHFASHDRARLAPLVSAVIANVIAAARLQAEAAPDAPGDVVVAPTGHVELASRLGAAWLAIPGFRDALRDYVRALDRGEETVDHALYRFRADPHPLRLEGDGSVRYLVNLRPIPLLRVPPDHGLTQAERAVAELAALGATATEIAKARGTGAGTVRNQLKKIYAALGVSSRVELAAALVRAR